MIERLGIVVLAMIALTGAAQPEDDFRPTAEEQKKESRQSAREARLNKPPTWQSAFMKAALMAGLLFVFTQIGLFGSKAQIGQSIAICLFALLLYTPIAYATDRFVYTRAQKRKQQAKG